MHGEWRGILRCWLGLHTLGEYQSRPVVVRRDPWGILVVRAAVGTCTVCGRSVVRKTQATPRWQQRLWRNQARWFFQRVVGDFRKDQP